MSDSSPPNLEAARDRLEQALSRLEEFAAKLGQESAAQAAESTALKIDRESLGRALKQAESDYQELLRVTDTVSGRLDATILDLKSVLEQ